MPSFRLSEKPEAVGAEMLKVFLHAVDCLNRNGRCGRAFRLFGPCRRHIALSICVLGRAFAFLLPAKHTMGQRANASARCSASWSLSDSRHPAGESWCLSVDASVGGAGGKTAGAPAAGSNETPSLGGAFGSPTTQSRLLQRQQMVRR